LPNKLSAELVDAVVATSARWRDTLTANKQPDVEKAKQIICDAHPKQEIKFYTARSPIEFFTIQGLILILGGELHDRPEAIQIEKIKQKIADLGIDTSFIANVTGDKKTNKYNLVRQCKSQIVGNNYVCNALLNTFRDFVVLADGSVISLSDYNKMRGPGDHDRLDDIDFMTLRKQNETFVDIKLHNMPVMAGASSVGGMLPISMINSTALSPSVQSFGRSGSYNWLAGYFLRDKNNDTHRIYTMIRDHYASDALSHSGCRYSGVSTFMDDIVRGDFIFRAHKFDAVAAEIHQRIFHKLGGTALNCWQCELLHHIPAFYAFNNSFILMANEPTIYLNEDMQFHNETGPAVRWADGFEYWALDGNDLEEFGPKILLRPEKLTTKDISNIRNEEARRIAIERLGWSTYLKRIKAKVRNNRVNWVDNTHEALIEPPRNSLARRSRTLAAQRMLLACRSTGRKYFIAVPRRANNDITQRIENIDDCEKAQNWLAGGGFLPYIDYAKHPVRVVGAS
jgi:hypothetical protein